MCVCVCVSETSIIYSGTQSNSGLKASPVEVVPDEHEASVDEIPEIIQKLRVVLGNEITPIERTVLYCIYVVYM